MYTPASSSRQPIVIQTTTSGESSNGAQASAVIPTDVEVYSEAVMPSGRQRKGKGRGSRIEQLRTASSQSLVP